jgi:hypothetical protein
MKDESIELNIDSLVMESTLTGNVAQGRPQLLSVTRAVNALIYKDLVAIQKTELPSATLYGLRYLNEAGDMTFVTQATYAGQYGDRTAITKITEASSSVKTGDIFVYGTDVFEAILDSNIMDENGDTLTDKVHVCLMKNIIRLASDAAVVDYHERGDKIQEIDFSLDRWTVDTRTRKYKTQVTDELISNLNSNQLDGSAIVYDMLATTISEEINKDIVQKLQTVSKRHVSAITPEGILDVTALADDPTQSRQVYRIVSDMAYGILGETTFESTYVLCTPNIAALLSASGWMRGDPNMVNLYAGVLTNGIKVYIDSNTKFDYIVVGTTQESNELEKIGSLFYSPYVDVDEAGTYQVVVDPSDMQSRYTATARYGLSTNPYSATDDTENQLYDGDDWINLAGKSKYSRFVGLVGMR